MSVQDVILIPIILGMVMIPTYVGYTIVDEFNTDLSTEYPVVNSHFDEGINAMQVIDTMMIFLIVGIGISAILLAAYLRTHPAFSIIAIFLAGIVVTVSAWLANIWWEFQNVTQFSTAANDLPNFVKINNELPLITAVFAVLIIIALYAKPWEREAATSF